MPPTERRATDEPLARAASPSFSVKLPAAARRVAGALATTALAVGPAMRMGCKVVGYG